MTTANHRCNERGGVPRGVEEEDKRVKRKKSEETSEMKRKYEEKE